jgi:hypothetical protein
VNEGEGKIWKEELTDMATHHRITCGYAGRDLQIEVHGDFDGSSAWELVNAIHERYTGLGRIVIDTRKITSLVPFGTATFKSRLDPRRVPLDRLVFVGENSAHIAPQGSRLAAAKGEGSCRCDGRCAECTCKGKDQVMKNPGRIQGSGH